MAEHAFALCERAHTAGMRLPLELVEGNGQSWLCDWVRSRGLVLVVVADQHRPLRFTPGRLVAHLRRGTTVPLVLVK